MEKTRFTCLIGFKTRGYRLVFQIPIEHSSIFWNGYPNSIKNYLINTLKRKYNDKSLSMTGETL